MGKQILGLTMREIDVLRLVAKGLDNIQISKELGVSWTTVVTHLKNVYAKTGISYENIRTGSAYRVRAALYYLENKEVFENERL